MNKQSTAIKLCIDRCIRAKDGRGHFQAEKSLRDTLAFQGDPKIAALCAESARRIGMWLAGVRA
jgi:hypothetical protein